MIDPAALGTVAAAFFVVAAAPGPATLGCASVAMAHGRRAGLGFGAGLGAGLAVWGVLAALGLGAILETSAQALFALKIAGGLYLLWLARSAGRAALSEGALAAETGSGRWVRRGLFLNLSNPKAVFAWMATLALGLDPATGAGGVALATALCAAIGFAIYFVWAFGFSVAGVRAAYAKARRWVDGVVAALFAAAGLGLIRSAFARGAG